jgi:4'-phosphopantetheinyl transferase
LKQGIHLRIAPVALLAQDAEGQGAWLSPAEASRLARISAAGRRAEFIAGRWLARQLLALAGGGQPSQWKLSAPDSGPPLAQGPHGSAPLHVGLSHSGGRVACAVAIAAIGLDLEVPRRSRDLRALAEVVCSPGEQARLAAEPGRVELLFYPCWTLKEAWLKSRGEGMSPGRLAQLHTEPAMVGSGNARVWQANGCTLALVAPPDAAVQCIGEGLGWPTAWAITDLG